MSLQVLLCQPARAGTSKADARVRTAVDTAADDPIPGRAGAAASQGTGEADVAGVGPTGPTTGQRRV